MTHLTRLSLANRLIVGLITLAIFGFGLYSVFALKQELLPSIQAPTALVTARYTGASPQLVARDVSTPLENSIKAVSGVTKVRSTSTNGVAVITAEWKYGLDSDKLVSNIRNAVATVQPTLPTDVKTDVATGSTDDIPALQLAVASDAAPEKASRTVNDVAVPDLSAVPGVREVVLTGQNETRVGVTLRPDKLRDHDLSAAVVTQSLQAQTQVVPAGTAYDKNLELAVQVGNDTDSLTQVKAIPLATADGPVALSDVARVRVEQVESTSVARSNGRPALSLSVLKNSDADAVEISHAVNAKIPELEKKLGSNTSIATVFDQAPLIQQSIHDLAVEGALGLVFAVLVILLFLFSLRSTIITAISIPLSLLIALIGLNLGGYSLNIFTLAALTVAVGRVVDDSIVIIENIKRRSLGHLDLTPGDIVAAVREVAGAVTASTLTTVAVFLPVATVSGITGELFKPFAITVTIALVGSLVVSMTIVPVLAYWFMRRRRNVPRATRAAPAGAAAGAGVAAGAAGVAAAAADGGTSTGEELRVTRLQRAYLPVLRFGLHHPVITLAVALLVFAGTLGGSTLLKTDFLGSFADEHTLQVTQELGAGTRLSVTDAQSKRVEQKLVDLPMVKGYLTTIGGGGIRGFAGDNGVNKAAYTVTLKDGYVAANEKAAIQQALDTLPDAGKITVGTTDSGGASNDVTVVVSGDNADALRKGAAATEQLVGSVPGLADVRSDLADQRKLLSVDVDLRKAARKGFTQAEVGQAVASALTGTKVGSVTLDGESHDILLRTESIDATPREIGKLELPVSQLQQQQATKKATDRLKDKQQAFSDRQKAAADDAASKQQDALYEQRGKAADALASTQKALRTLKANPPKLPKAPSGGFPAAAGAGAPQAGAAAPAPGAGAPPAGAGPGAGGPSTPAPAPTPSCESQDCNQPPQVPPAATPDPVQVLQAQVAAAQAAAVAATRIAATAAAQAAVAQAQVSGLQAAAAAQAYAQQVGQLSASVEQTKQTIQQLDKQIAAAAEQTQKSKDTQAEQQKLTDAQAKIADVRAGAITVNDVADVKEVLAPTAVTQIGGTPTVTITATPSGSDLGTVTKTLQQRIDTADTLPAGVTATLGGSAQDQQDAFRQLGLAMLVAIALVFVIMVATFRSLVQPLVLLVSIPFAATGALVGLLVTDTPLGVPAMVGLLMLIGIVVTNAIVLIDLINQYRRRGEDVETAVVDGARLRLRPIIMTAAATICALFPMALGLTGGGAFISRPLAVVVIGGLVSSTILTLLLVPTLYYLIERSGERRRSRRAQRTAPATAG